MIEGGGTIAFFRNSPSDRADIANSLSLLSRRFVDVCHDAYVKFDQVALGAPPQVFLAGIDLSQFDRIFFFSYPGSFQRDDQETQYVSGENYAAILSALGQVASKLVNAGPVLDHGGLLHNSFYMLTELSSLGWQTPTAHWRYDFASGETSRSLFPVQNHQGWSAGLLIVTQRNWYRVPFDDPFYQWVHIADLVTKTQRWMITRQLDFVTLTLAISPEGVHCVGAAPEIPPLLDPESLSAVLADCMR